MKQRQVEDWLIEQFEKNGRIPGEETVFLKFAGRVSLDEMVQGIMKVRQQVRNQKRGAVI